MRWRLFLRQKNQASNTVFRNNEKSLLAKSSLLIHCRITVFENHPKSLIQNCERSELRLQFEWTKVHQKCQKMVYFGNFLKT